MGFVKKNYFSSRLDQPAQKLIAGIPDWCKRKNIKRLNTATHRIPMEQFIEGEKQALRPNLTSSYGCSETLMGPVHVDKMRVLVYKTNKYSIPPVYRFKNVYYRISNGVLSIFGDEQGTRLVRQHDVAPLDVKHQLYMHPDDQRLPSNKWEDVKKDLLHKYPGPSMLQFLNGVCKENEHYREPQLSAILAWLENHQSTPEFLESVVARCCETFSYKMSQFQAIYEGIRKEREDLFTADLPKPNPITMPNGVSVQVRGQSSYEDLFQRKVQQTAREGV